MAMEAKEVQYPEVRRRKSVGDVEGEACGVCGGFVEQNAMGIMGMHVDGGSEEQGKCI